MIIDQLRTKHF